MKKFIPRNWRNALDHPVSRVQWRYAIKKLNIFLKKEAVANHRYHPRGRDIFNAFHATPFDSVRVVIIGQDPYPDKNKATGLAFSMPDDKTDLSLSIKRIYCAIKRDDVKGVKPEHGNLDHWAKQGVLLLNPVLTFYGDNDDKNMHKGNKGWERFTRAVLKSLSNSGRPIQFILWGYDAQKLKPHITGQRYHIHKSPHPTPPFTSDINAFLNCRHFSAVNAILKASGEREINWFEEPPRHIARLI